MGKAEPGPLYLQRYSLGYVMGESGAYTLFWENMESRLCDVEKFENKLSVEEVGIYVM